MRLGAGLILLDESLALDVGDTPTLIVTFAGLAVETTCQQTVGADKQTPIGVAAAYDRLRFSRCCRGWWRPIKEQKTGDGWISRCEDASVLLWQVLAGIPAAMRLRIPDSVQPLKCKAGSQGQLPY